MNSLNQTFLPNDKYENRRWYIIDCKGQKLGRLATLVANLLKGKTKTYYYPSIDTGDYIILINANSIQINKDSKHYLVFKPGRPGRSLKIRNAQTSIPKFTIEHAVKGMLSRTEKKRLIRRLNIYNDQNYLQKAQNPTILDLSKIK